MKKLYILTIAAAMLSMFASCEKEDETSKITTGKIQITEFSYPSLPATGGTVTPQLSYTYKAKTASGVWIDMSSGATTEYSCDYAGVTIDKSTGKITAQANVTGKPISFDVEVLASTGYWDTKKSITVIQADARDIVETKTVLLPLELGEYPYITVPGTGDVVSATGVDITVKGGDIATINTYRSGKVDTTVISKADVTTSTVYRFIPELYYEYNKKTFTVDEESQAPKCSFANGIWKIEKMGYGYYVKISHTLKATVEGKEQSVTIQQQDNDCVGETSPFLKIHGHEFYTQRDNWPNFEDYPIGCSPKWIRDEYPYENEWHNPMDTKDLHPDGNRYIDFFFRQYIECFPRRNIYTSGAVQPEIHDFVTWYNLFRGGVTITATADVKMKDGSTQTVIHKSEWIQPLILPGGEKYNGRDASDLQGFYTIYLPVVENAAEDFEWTLKFAFNLTDKHIVVGCNIKENSNILEYDWAFPEYKFKDCLSSVEEYIEAKKFSGIMGKVEFHERCQADIIDGVEHTFRPEGEM